MKRVIASLAIFAVILTISVLHINKTLSLSNVILGISRSIDDECKKDNWDIISEKLGKIEKEWDKNHMWAYLTLSTEQIDEIEISLKQSIEYCNVKAKEDFVGEFRMFCMLIDHLPKQEAFSIGELL